MKKEPLPKGAWWKISRFWIWLLVIMVVVFVLLGALVPTCSIKSAQRNACMQQGRQIAQCLYSYAQDHGGKYPDGKTSTEVFQQLLDQNYVTDPSLFYVGYMRIPGKVSPINSNPQGARLKPENVSWDVTGSVDSSSPDKLPVIFITGYKITYQPGAAAVLPNAPPARTWSQWWNGVPAWESFMAVTYKDNSTVSMLANPDGTIPNFIPADFDPKGKIYRQLTP